MLYFNHSKPATAPATPQEYHLQIARRNLVVTLDEKNRLTYCLNEAGRRIEELRAENERLQQAHDGRGMGLWELIAVKDRAMAEQAQIIDELKAELDDMRAENVRLTGQVHALLAVIEQAVSA